jgi:crotonobetainyl-CoA:carnitine CoA-transferase CaiB-like acyl-CoA transferase
MRAYQPLLGPDGVNFTLLNRGKDSLAVDLKTDEGRERILAAVDEHDVVVEQFRPGVMDRLGLGYAALAERNPQVIYCSITGYGQTGPKAALAGHDLTYVADTGMLDLTAGVDGSPVMPAALVADIAGGAYPAFMNIVLALRERDRTGRGAYLDVAMTDNVFPFLYWAMGSGATGAWPRSGAELVTGGSPRYNIYRTADDRFLAAAPLEDQFWTAFCDAIELDEALRDDARDPDATRAGVAARVREHTAAEWVERFGDRDVCTLVVRDVEEALQDEHFRARGLFDGRTTTSDGRHERPALPSPIVPALRMESQGAAAPPVGRDAASVEGGAR